MRIGIPLAFDLYQFDNQYGIDTGLISDWHKICIRLAWIDNELVLEWYWIDAQLVGLPWHIGLAMDYNCIISAVTPK